MQPQIGISSENLTAVAHQINTLLADEFILYVKTKNAHWNLEGPDFHTIHLFFESQAEQLNEIIDAIAERIRSLGHYAPAKLKNFLELAHLTEMLYNKNDSHGFISELLNDHESLIIRLREQATLFGNKYRDLGSADFLTGIMENHEKMAWMLRSHLG